MEQCPLQNTKHFEACGITSDTENCKFKRDCTEMLKDSNRFESEVLELNPVKVPSALLMSS